MSAQDVAVVINAIIALKLMLDTAEKNKKKAHELYRRCEANGRILRDIESIELLQSETVTGAVAMLITVINDCCNFVDKYSVKDLRQRVLKIFNAVSIEAEFDELCRRLDHVGNDLTRAIGVKTAMGMNHLLKNNLISPPMSPVAQENSVAKSSLETESAGKSDAVVAFVSKLHCLKEADERAHLDNPRDGSVRGVLSGCWRLKGAALVQLFEADDSPRGVRVRRSYPEGRGVRDVAVVKTDPISPEERGLSFHFKANPEFPFNELAINQLGLMLFGDAVLHDVLEVFMSGMWHVFLVSETVVGVTLADELQWFNRDIHEDDRQQLSKALMARMNRRSFGVSCLMAMLCRLQDQKPDNVLIREDGTLACIDNERAFVVDRYGSWNGKSEVQSVLFCMDAMNDSIDSEIVKLVDKWDDNYGFKLVTSWLRRLDEMVSEMGKRSLYHINAQSFALAPAIVWKLISGITNLRRFAAVLKYRRMFEVLLPETSRSYVRVLSEFGSIHRKFRNVTEYGKHSLCSTLTTMDVMLKLVNERVGEVDGVKWQPSSENEQRGLQLETPTVLLSLIPHIQEQLMNTVLAVIKQLNHEGTMDEKSWRRLIERGKALQEMGLLDHVLEKVDYSLGMLRERENQLRFIKILESLSHNRIMLANATHLTERELAFLKNSPNLTSLSIKCCPNMTSLPASTVQRLQKVRTLQLVHMSLGDVLDVSKMISLAKLDLIEISGLRRLILSPACEYLDLTDTWSTEMDFIELGQTIDLKRENTIGVGSIGSLALEHARDEAVKGNLEPLHHMPTTNDIEDALEMLDWSQIAERSANSSSPRRRLIELISKHSFHRFFVSKALWLIREQVTEMLRQSSYLKLLCLRGSNITKESVLWILSTGNLAQLESLDVSGCTELILSPGEISKVAENLRHLNMSNTGIRTFETTEVVFGGFSRRFYLQSLQSLSLSNCSSLASFSLQLPNLRNLDVSSCGAVEVITSVINRSTVSIHLTGTQLFRQLQGHTRSVNAVMELRDGRLVSGSDDGTVRVWDVVNGECTMTLLGHSNSVCSIVELRDGRLASGSRDKTVRVKSVSLGEGVLTLRGHSSWVESVVELRDGRLASGSLDSTIKVWDVNSGECSETLRGHTNSVSSIVELRDGRLASGSYDKTVIIWDMGNTAQVIKLMGHTHWVTCVNELRDGRLISGSRDESLRIWDVSCGECLMTLQGHSNKVNCVIELRNGRIASGADDNTLKIWDVLTGECALTLNHSGTVTSVVELRHGRLASGCGDNAVRLWTII